MSERFTANGAGKAYFIGWGYNIKDYIEERDYRQDEWLDALAEKMQEYEDAEEAGLLVTLPIKIDERAWVTDNGTVKPVRVIGYKIGIDGLSAHVEYLSPLTWKNINAERLHSSKEQAEAALKGDEQPSADMEPVRHGKWILEREPDGTPYCFHCSNCDSDGHYIGITTAYDYCPNCGAKMKGANND